MNRRDDDEVSNQMSPEFVNLPGDLISSSLTLSPFEEEFESFVNAQLMVTDQHWNAFFRCPEVIRCPSN